MGLGPCQYLTCESTLGSEFRARIRVITPDLRETTELIQARVCSTHERHLKDAEKRGETIRGSLEGWLYLESWMVAPVYKAW